MALAQFSYSVAPRVSDGVVGSFKPVNIISPDVTWNNGGLPDLINRPNGTAISEDMRVLLSGAGAATAVLTIITVSGDDAVAVGGFSIAGGGDDLDSAAGTDGSGVLKVRATYLGADFDSASMNWSIVTAASPDILPPTVGLFKSLVAVSPTQVDLAIFPPVDPKSPTSDADGLLSVKIERELAGAGFSEVAAKAVSPGLSLQYSGTNIGGVSPAPGFVQTGADWAITSGGAQLWQTTDNCAFAHASIVGDFIATVLCKQFTGVVGAFSKCGIHARDGIAADAAWVTVFSMSDPSDGANDYVKPEYRPSAGASAQAMNLKTGGLTGERWLRLERVGNTFSAYFWQTSLPDWVLLGSQSVVMPAAIEVGLVSSSQDVNNEYTVNFEEFAVQNLAVILHSDTGLVQNTSYNYRALATDLEIPTNTGAVGPFRSITTPLVVPPQLDYEDVLDEMVGWAKHVNVQGGAGRPLITVTNLNNGGSGSYRQAQIDNPNGAWIIFTQGLTGTINLTASMPFVSKTTTDGRGADITFNGNTGSGFTFRTLDGSVNDFILMYVKVTGTVQDNINVDFAKNFWLHHLDIGTAGDERLSIRKTDGNYTVQEVDFSSGTTKAILFYNSTSYVPAFDDKYCVGTFFRNDLGARTRLPRINAPTLCHIYNNYVHSFNDVATVGATLHAQSLPAEVLYENNIVDADGTINQYLKMTSGNLPNSGKAKSTGNLELNGAFAAERLASQVFVPPYAYTKATATTALRDDILSTVGWRNVVNPAH